MAHLSYRAHGGGLTFALTLGASTFLMGSSFVASKILLRSGIPPMLLVGSRFLLAALMTLALISVSGGGGAGALWPRHISLREGGLVAAIGLLQTAMVMGLLSLALRSIPASTAAILLFTNPIWVVVLERLLFGEPLRRLRIVGMVVGIAGVAVAIGLRPGALTAGTGVGELVGLAAALCWSAATIINKQAHLPISPWALNFWQMLVGALALLGAGYGLGEHWPAGIALAGWGWFVWLAGPASAGAFGLWFLALSRGSAVRASSFLFLAPLFAVVQSFAVLGTGLSWLEAASSLLIGAALWLINCEEKGK